MSFYLPVFIYALIGLVCAIVTATAVRYADPTPYTMMAASTEGIIVLALAAVWPILLVVLVLSGVGSLVGRFIRYLVRTLHKHQRG